MYDVGELYTQLLDEYCQYSVAHEDLIQAISLNKSNFSMLIVDGFFIYKCELKNLIDVKVFMGTDFDLTLQRYQSRKMLVGNLHAIEVFDDIWLPSHLRYISEEQSIEIVDIVVHN